MRKGLKAVNMYFPEDVLSIGKELAFMNSLSFSAFMRELLIKEVEKEECKSALNEFRRLKKVKT